MWTIRLHALAESDLLGIWAYSAEQWEAPQADQYLDGLDRGIRSLARNPEQRVDRDYVRKGYRVLFVGRHAIYYTAARSTIHVIRVLHGQMDPEHHL